MWLIRSRLPPGRPEGHAGAIAELNTRDSPCEPVVSGLLPRLSQDGHTPRGPANAGPLKGGVCPLLHMLHSCHAPDAALAQGSFCWLAASFPSFWRPVSSIS